MGSTTGNCYRGPLTACCKTVLSVESGQHTIDGHCMHQLKLMHEKQLSCIAADAAALALVSVTTVHVLPLYRSAYSMFCMPCRGSATHV